MRMSSMSWMSWRWMRRTGQPRGAVGPGESRGRRRARQRWASADTGMTTSEYAMGTIAACAFAAVLYKVVTSGAVSGALESLIGRALDAQF